MVQTFTSGQKMIGDTEKKKTFFNFAKEHKKVIAIGATACIVMVGVVIFKNRTATNALNIEEVVSRGLKTHGDSFSIGSEAVEACHASNLPNNKLINVNKHLRNLPDGWKASQSKIDLASLHGFSLEDHQTWVNSYAKTAA